MPLSLHCGPSIHLHPAMALENFVHLEYFHDHVRIERMLFDGVVDPVDGALIPDLERPGNGLELKRGEAERYAASSLVENVRNGRMQRTLAAVTALSALPLGLEIYFEHFKGSFGDKWMWTPVALSPALTAAGLAGVRSERAATTVLPAVSALYCLDGLIGVVTHVRGVARKPGGFDEPLSTS